MVRQYQMRKQIEEMKGRIAELDNAEHPSITEEVEALRAENAALKEQVAKLEADFQSQAKSLEAQEQAPTEENLDKKENPVDV